MALRPSYVSVVAVLVLCILVAIYTWGAVQAPFLCSALRDYQHSRALSAVQDGDWLEAAQFFSVTADQVERQWEDGGDACHNLGPRWGIVPAAVYLAVSPLRLFREDGFAKEVRASGQARLGKLLIGAAVSLERLGMREDSELAYQRAAAVLYDGDVGQAKEAGREIEASLRPSSQAN